MGFIFLNLTIDVGLGTYICRHVGNNNHLFRHNHKKTYSLPQKIPVNRNVAKCAAGYDYILILNSQPGSLSCFYQSAFYQIGNLKAVVDVSTTDNMIVVVTADGGAWIMEFNPEKIVEEELTPTRLHLQENVKSVFMNYGDIFLLCESKNVYHLKRNEWYETKTYSDPQKIEGIDGKEIKSIAPALHYNYLLTTEGYLYYSSKNEPTKVMPSKIGNKFVSIAAADYFMGVSDQGRLLIWGQYGNENYQNPTEFGRLTQVFKSVTLSSENGYAVTTAGEAWIWGKNANGELGISDYEPRSKPFPLITMEKEKIRNIYSGEGYTVCLIEIGQQKPKKNMKSYAIESMTFANNIPKPRQSKKSMSRDLSSIQLSENHNKSTSKGKEVSLKPIRTEVLRQIDPQQQQRKRTSDVKTPQKISQRSKSPMGSQKSGNSKSPVSKGFKSPYLEHLREKSHSNNKLKKDPANKSKSTLSPAKAFDYTLQIKSLEEENLKLRKMLALKETIIDDITSKIRMLEDAIDQHEKNLTARDHLMQQYQRRQKEYQIHIDELQKSIQMLIKGKNERPASEDYFNDMYKSLKNEFSKEKEYYMNRMKSYEEQLQVERAQYKQKIKMLEEEVYTYRSHSHRDRYERHESKYLDGYDLSSSNVGNKIKEYMDSSLAKEENKHKMELMISRIEDSKVRIGKSATKLIEMLET